MWYKLLFIITIIIIIWILIQKNVSERYTPENYINTPKDEPINSSIVTYNIQKFPFSLKSLNDKKIRSIIKNHSIILLQECFNEAYDSLETYYPEYHICRGVLQGLNIMNSGLVIMSKFPIIDVNFKEYNVSNPWSFDYFSEKGFLIASIKIKNKNVKIINTHLQSSDFHRYDKYALSQLNELFNYLNELKENKDEYIVGGDFNIDINDIKNIKEINSIKELNTIKELNNIKYPKNPTIYINLTTSGTNDKYKEGYEPFIFDYFMISNSINMKTPIVINNDYSDHNPVSSTFEL
jgi:endonuclease/exonuclease/phosphatase family metal-dependent hydrolase